MLRKIKEYIRAADLCSNQCFNANQAFNHKEFRYGNAYRRYDTAWNNLPMFLRKWLKRK